jgi:phage host-nuclease inhibitor protein Gam
MVGAILKIAPTIENLDETISLIINNIQGYCKSERF